MAAVIDNQVQTNITSTTGTWVLDAAADIAVDDLMIAIIECANATAGASPAAPTATGWALVDQANVSNADVVNAVLWKVADSTDAAADDFTFTINHTNSPGTGHILRVTGADPLDPIGSDTSTVYEASNKYADIPSLTTDEDDSLVIVSSATDESSDRRPYWLSPPVTGFTAVIGSAAGDALGGSFVASSISYAVQATAGATGVKRVELTNFDRQAAVMFAVNPAPIPAPWSVTIENDGTAGSWIAKTLTTVSTTLFDVRFDGITDDWTPTYVQLMTGPSAVVALDGTNVLITYLGGGSYRQTFRSITNLGLVDTERAQIRCVLDTDAGDADFYVRLGGDIRALDDDTGWTAKGAGITITGAATRDAVTSQWHGVIAQANWAASFDGSFIGARVYDLDNSAVNWEVYSTDFTALTDGTTVNGYSIYNDGSMTLLGNLIVPSALASTVAIGAPTVSVEVEGLTIAPTALPSRTKIGAPAVDVVHPRARIYNGTALVDGSVKVFDGTKLVPADINRAV